jgi:hypothetical protein
VHGTLFIIIQGNALQEVKNTDSRLLKGILGPKREGVAGS